MVWFCCFERKKRKEREKKVNGRALARWVFTCCVTLFCWSSGLMNSLEPMLFDLLPSNLKLLIFFLLYFVFIHTPECCAVLWCYVLGLVRSGSIHSVFQYKPINQLHNAYGPMSIVRSFVRSLARSLFQFLHSNALFDHLKCCIDYNTFAYALERRDEKVWWWRKICRLK